MEGNFVYSEVVKLLEKSKAGDLEAIEILLYKLKPLILASIRRYYNKVDEYDDLIQEGYEIILVAIEEYEENRGTQFLGYVKLQLKYHYLNKHREKTYASLNEPLGDGEIELIDLIEADTNILEEYIAKEESEYLMKKLNTLTKRQKQILIEFYINGYSIGEIAEKLKISYRTVANTKTSGINKLKKTMVK